MSPATRGLLFMLGALSWSAAAAVYVAHDDRVRPGELSGAVLLTFAVAAVLDHCTLSGGRR